MWRKRGHDDRAMRPACPVEKVSRFMIGGARGGWNPQAPGRSPDPRQRLLDQSLGRRDQIGAVIVGPDPGDAMERHQVNQPIPRVELGPDDSRRV